MKRITSINIKPANLTKSEAHNERRVRLDYILPNMQGEHEHWKTSSVSDRMKEINLLYQEQVGQSMQEKAKPIREGVIVIKPETTMNDLRLLGERLKEKFKIECFQIHIHRDEGHVVTDKEAEITKALGETPPEVGTIIINHHAHMVFDWQEKNTGRSIKLNREDMREMQTITAEVLDMERGQANSKANRLEAQEFKVYKQKLQENAANELKKIEELKKKLFPELKALGDSYTQTMKELNSSKEELMKWESKFWLLNKLRSLSWESCTNNVQEWLNHIEDLKGTEVKNGKDGSFYFQLNDRKARFKDLPIEIQILIQKRLDRTKTIKSSIRY